MCAFTLMMQRILVDSSTTFSFSQEEYEMVYRTVYDEVQTTSRQLYNYLRNIAVVDFWITFKNVDTLNSVVAYLNCTDISQMFFAYVFL